MSKHCEKNIETHYIPTLPVDTLESLPDYILAERDTVDPRTETVDYDFVRVPVGKLFPTANLDNVFALEPNNLIEVPEKQVRACYVADTGSEVQMFYADASHEAMFLAIGTVADLILCQNCGIVNIPNGHDYIIGAQYYAGNEGEPVTNIVGAKKLFVPISRTKLLVNM